MGVESERGGEEENKAYDGEDLGHQWDIVQFQIQLQIKDTSL